MQRGEGAKVNKLLVAIVIAFCVVMVLMPMLCVMSLSQLPLAINSAEPPKEFCTLDDPIVRAIEANGDAWLQILETVEGNPKIHFVEINNQRYGVRLSGNEETHIFYLTTQGRWPGTAEYGNNGYFYSPERDPSFTFGIRLVAEQLTESVYCYWWNYDA